MTVNDVTVLLFCRDERVSELAGEIIRRVAGLRLMVVSGADEVLARAGRGAVGLVLIHQGEAEDATEATRIIRGLIAGGRTTPALVISETHRAKEALGLLRLGAADYLSRPLDLNRLAYLVDMLTLRARCTVAPPRT